MLKRISCIFVFVASISGCGDDPSSETQTVGAQTAASHLWSGYHWARTDPSFTLNLGDNVNSTWDPYLAVAAVDWSQSTVIDTIVVAGRSKPSSCRATSGRVEVCNARYGNNGWLGLASIWTSGSHITAGTVRVNDTYFNSAPYNTPAWRRLVMCQEVGHTFGLDHQDEGFGNPNLGSCMDYTSDPDGPPSNEHPNQHDYDQLEILYQHLDSAAPALATARLPDGSGSDGWGKRIRSTHGGRTELYELDYGGGRKTFTFVIWSD